MRLGQGLDGLPVAQAPNPLPDNIRFIGSLHVEMVRQLCTGTYRPPERAIPFPQVSQRQLLIRASDADSRPACLPPADNRMASNRETRRKRGGWIYASGQRGVPSVHKHRTCMSPCQRAKSPPVSISVQHKRQVELT